MRELTKAVVSSSWALSLFGARQMADAFSSDSSRDSSGGVARSMDAVATEVTSRLSGRVRHLYDLGDNAQRGMVDITSAALRFNVTDAIRPSIDVAQPFVEGLGLVTPRRDWLIDWQELRNKIDIFDLVQNVENRVDARPDTPIAELVDRAYGLGDFHALWAVEGLGHYFAQQSLNQTDSPQSLLADPVSLGLPGKSVTMLSAGIGLAFAERLLDGLSPQSPPEEFARVVQRFVELCRANTTSGYTGAALESLGLVTRTFQTKLLLAVDRAILSTGNKELLGYFWHGAGRGIYFSRENFLPLPCCGIRWDSVANEAPHETGRRNIIAGVAWAVTLVNMRTPQVMNKLLRRRSIVDREGFANGVGSSIVMRSDTTPDAHFLRSYCQGIGSQTSPPALWSSLVQQPCADAIERYHPVLKQRNRLGEVFRFQSLSGLSRV
ncbi:MAG TPA: hypothetical protein VMM76_23970 [Pirellulaceae bacterium]|nr:hypothetical protein [Pirellulaceae bacterium]